MADGTTNETQQLLAYVKAQLGVTWDDEATDLRYEQLIADSIAYFDDKLGEAGDYTSPALREMVKERVRYARDAALDVFENNYQTAILAAQNNRKVATYGSQMASAVPLE